MLMTRGQSGGGGSQVVKIIKKGVPLIARDLDACWKPKTRLKLVGGKNIGRRTRGALRIPSKSIRRVKMKERVPGPRQVEKPSTCICAGSHNPMI